MVIEIYKAPMPERDSVVGAMRRMKVGETFMVPVKSANTRRGLYATATVAGIKIKTVVREGKIQVWRVPGGEPKPRGHKLSHDETKVAMGVEPEVDDIEDEFEEKVHVVAPEWEMNNG